MTHRETVSTTTFITSTDAMDASQRIEQAARDRGIPTAARRPVAIARPDETVLYCVHDNEPLHLIVASINQHIESADPRFEDLHECGYEWVVWDETSGRHACGRATGEDYHYFAKGRATEEMAVAMAEFGWEDFPSSWTAICTAAVDLNVVKSISNSPATAVDEISFD